jgi:hypothetical protein
VPDDTISDVSDILASVSVVKLVPFPYLSSVEVGVIRDTSGLFVIPAEVPVSVNPATCANIDEIGVTGLTKSRFPVKPPLLDNVE